MLEFISLNHYSKLTVFYLMYIHEQAMLLYSAYFWYVLISLACHKAGFALSVLKHI